MKSKDLQKIAQDVQDVIKKSKATFFVVDPKTAIPEEEVLRELKDEIITNVGIYFYKKMNNEK